MKFASRGDMCDMHEKEKYQLVLNSPVKISTARSNHHQMHGERADVRTRGARKVSYTILQGGPV